MSEQREYWAFISYRHLDNKDPGREWASWIAREIETYEVPADLVGTKNERGEVIPERLYPVFRDEDELSAGADLSSPIYAALRRSKSLVVICSPRAIGSRYVGNEINFYKTLDRPCGVLAMMIEGEPHAGDEHECFPRELKHPVDNEGNLDTNKDVEPVAADFRLPDGSQGWHSLEECRNNLADEANVTRFLERCELAKLKILAGILGVPLGRLVKRDKAYQLVVAKKRARLITRVAAAMALLAALAIAAGIFAWQKRQQAITSNTAAEQTRNAAKQLENMFFDLRDKLDPLGRIDLLDHTTAAAEQYFASLPPGMITAETERRRSIVLDTRAQILEDNGDLEAALQSRLDSLEIARQLSADRPGDAKLQQEVAVSLQEISDVLIAQNLIDDAIVPLLEAKKIITTAWQTATGQPGATALLSTLQRDKGEKARRDAIEIFTKSSGLADLFGTQAVIEERLGNLSQFRGDAPSARDHYQAARDIQQALAVVQPDTDYWRRGLASSCDKIGNMYFQAGNYAEAREQFQILNGIVTQELIYQPGNAIWKDLHAGAIDRLATIDSIEGKTADALEKSLLALAIWKSLAANDPTNLTRQRNLFVGLHKLGLAKTAAGETADETFDEARSIARQLVDADPTNATWRRDFAFSLDKLTNIQRAAGDQKLALKTANQALGHHRMLAEGDPDNLQLRRNMLLTLYGIAINHWALEDLNAGLEIFKQSAQLAASILDDLVEPTWQSHKDLGDICVYSAQICEQARRPEEAVKWYRKALSVVQSAHQLEFIKEESKAEFFDPLEAKIAELEADGGADL